MGICDDSFKDCEYLKNDAWQKNLSNNLSNSNMLRNWKVWCL